MDLDLTIVTGPTTAMLVLEGLKWIIRYYKKDMEYDFPLKFYSIALPVLNVLAVPALAFFGFAGYALPTDAIAWGRSVIQVLLASLISVFIYQNTLQPLKVYKKTLTK